MPSVTVCPAKDVYTKAVSREASSRSNLGRPSGRPLSLGRSIRQLGMVLTFRDPHFAPTHRRRVARVVGQAEAVEL